MPTMAYLAKSLAWQVWLHLAFGELFIAPNTTFRLYALSL